jgi:tetratricopeptide (TPR) repeat protein
MKINPKPLTLGLTLILLISSCKVISRSEDPQIEQVPGAFKFTEGRTSYPDLYRRALEHLGDSQFEQAGDVYQDLIAAEPENPNGYIGLGTSLSLQGRYEDAEEAYQEALRISPGSVEALIGMGSVSASTGDFSAASEYYTQALDHDPDHPNAHWGLALALHSMGKGEEAMRHLGKILELTPDSVLARQAADLMDAIRLEGK